MKLGLAELQRRLMDEVYAKKQEGALLSAVKRRRGVTVADQVNVYKSNVQGALQKSLEQTFPVCLKIVGEDYFRQLSRLFVATHPSRQADLNYYGEQFPAFLEEQCRQREELELLLYLNDLAALEWSVHLSYYADNTALFDLDAFATLTETQQQDAQFKLLPSVYVASSIHPVVAIWRANLRDKPPTEVELGSVNYCVVRANTTVEIFDLTSPVFDVLAAIDSGMPLKRLPLNGQENVLAELISMGWIDGFSLQTG